MAEVYKIYCKSERNGEPIAADVIVRGVNGPEAALSMGVDYFSSHPFLGLGPGKVVDIGFSELGGDETAFHSKPEIQAIGGQVVLVAFYENNPPPPPEHYGYKPRPLLPKL